MSNLTPPNPDELRALRIEVEALKDSLNRSERLRTLGELAAGVAHDFSNALSTILGRVARAREKQRLGEKIDEDLAVIEMASLNAADTVQRIRDFYNPNASEIVETVQLEKISLDAIKLIETRVPKTVALEVSLETTPPIRGSAAELCEVLVNLLGNALDAVHDRGSVQIQTFTEAGQAVVVVGDSGEGMTPEIQRRVFEPFFSTKAEHGTGLGLSVSHQILEKHDAQIHLKSEPQGGTEFRLIFAATDTSVLAPTEQTEKFSPMSILVVDDDATVGEMISEVLKSEGHQVHTVTTPDAALEIVERESIDVAITDLDLPTMNGWELTQKLRELKPQLTVGIITGWPLSNEEISRRGVNFILSKPFTLEKLLAALNPG